MSNHLRSCVKCSRHIRITEPACPFCKAAVAAERMTPPPRGTPAARLGRAFAVSTFAAAAAALGGTPACGQVESDPEIVSGADAYGVAPREAGPDDDAPDPPTTTTVSSSSAYGLAEPFDAGDAGDAEVIFSGADAYGLAPIDGDIILSDAAYGLAEPFDAGAPDVITGGQAYGVAEPEDGGPR
jgi:hypothetical protein